METKISFLSVLSYVGLGAFVVAVAIFVVFAGMSLFDIADWNFLSVAIGITALIPILAVIYQVFLTAGLEKAKMDLGIYLAAYLFIFPVAILYLILILMTLEVAPLIALLEKHSEGFVATGVYVSAVAMGLVIRGIRVLVSLLNSGNGRIGKLLVVSSFLILAVLTSLNVAAQNNAVTKDVSKMTLVETHAVIVKLLKEKLTNVRLQISECKNTDREKKLWALNASLEEELESSQVICPIEGDWDYSKGKKDYRQGVVKNYNEGELDIAVIYLFSMDFPHKPVIITLGPREEKRLSLDRGRYQIIITCGFYNKLFQSEIKGNDWLVSPITSASKIGMGDIFKMGKTAE